MEKKFRDKITNEELKLLPNAIFEGEVEIIDTLEQVEEACNYLLSCPILGFDTETKPSFKAGVSYKIGLLQLSSHERCFLFRLCNMRFDKPIIKILEDENIKKIGVDVKGDLRGLQALRHFKPRGFVELQDMVEPNGIMEKSLRKMSAIVLGKTISKAQRLSNWEGKILTEAQIRYAATDAWACIKIYEKLQ